MCGCVRGGGLKKLNFKKVSFSSFIKVSYRNVLCVFLRGSPFHQLKQTGNSF